MVLVRRTDPEPVFNKPCDEIFNWVVFGLFCSLFVVQTSRVRGGLPRLVHGVLPFNAGEHVRRPGLDGVSLISHNPVNVKRRRRRLLQMRAQRNVIHIKSLSLLS